MPIDLCRLDQALDKSLEAAVDPSLWPEILDRLTAAKGSFGANIIPANARSPDLIIATESGRPALEDYFADGWHINEWRLRGIPLIIRDGTMRDQQYTTRDQFEHLEYYRFQAEHGIGRTCIIGFSSPDDLLCLTLHRTLNSEVFSDEEAAVSRRPGID
ncbi:hypothetical protein AJ87_37555 [Rhizobium yanglingense]|nr:hypothetical protein AJ87_37555 [Rhizobium yanglingense]